MCIRDRLCVDEGSVVKKGQTLFVIDPVQYEEAVNVARAAVKVAEAGVCLLYTSDIYGISYHGRQYHEKSF